MPLLNRSSSLRSSSGSLPKDLVAAKDLFDSGKDDLESGQFENAIESFSQSLRLVRALKDLLSSPDLAPSSSSLTLSPRPSSDGKEIPAPNPADAGASGAGGATAAAAQDRAGTEATGAGVTLPSVCDLENQLLLHRSQAFARLCREYLSRPAAKSERGALFGLDPGHLAALALGDAQKVVTALPAVPEAQLRLGVALFLSERYGDSQEAYLAGLALDPTNKQLQEGLREVGRELQTDTEEEEAAAGAGAGSSAAARASHTPSKKRSRAAPCLDDCECILCMKLLYEPITTPCGHTFCRTCFARAMDHRNKCPVCRTVLHIGRELPVTVTLANILTKAYPEEYAERGVEEAQARLASSGSQQEGGAEVVPALPLFVMSTVFPGERMALNIFEPRYRLMIRRAMEGNRRIGMAQTQPGSHELEPVAVESELVECVPQPDGRYHIELIGRRRVELLACSELDGYRVARCRVLTDDPLPGGGGGGQGGGDGAQLQEEVAGGAAQAAETQSQAQELSSLAHEVHERTEGLVSRLRAWASGPSGRSMRGARILDVLERAGPAPAEDRPEALSLWAGSLVVSFSPSLDYSERSHLLNMRSTLDRMRFVHTHLTTMPLAAMAQGGGGPGAAGAGGPDNCVVM